MYIPYIRITNAMLNIQTMTQKRNRRSEPLTKDEHEAFKALFVSFPTKVDAEYYFGLSRQILDGVFLKGSGSTETVKTIRKQLRKAAVTRTESVKA